MRPSLVITVVLSYFVILIAISLITSKKASSRTFFTADRKSPWYLVAFGMIGTSLSGVTFISIPGWVGDTNFTYMQTVLGYLLGYFVIATVLMPLYYRLNLVSIYEYLEQRFGYWSYKSGAACFLVSRTMGASFRLLLVAGVLHTICKPFWDVPFWAYVFITILLIWIYTFRGGIKTIVWTDTLQTALMLAAVTLVVYMIGERMNLSLDGIFTAVSESKYAQVFEWDWKVKTNFFKNFFAGAFIAIVMTGLDQDMMQKNLTCKNIGEAQKNMFSFSVILVFVNILFLTLGALLYLFAAQENIAIPEKTDNLFPMIAAEYLDESVGIIFLLGIIAAAYSSADSALTALTTSFCVDFLGFEKGEDNATKKQTRIFIHISFSLILFLVAVVYGAINNEAIIESVFKAAGYTYGPLLGLFSFGILTKRPVVDKWVPLVCLASPALCFVLNMFSTEILWGYEFGFEILIVNGLLTFLSLLLLSCNKNAYLRA
ncbi:MAG: sodium:solute symporter [Bacteroidota bacterium]